MTAELDWMRRERAAAPPRPWRNPRRCYEADIAARRLEAGYDADVTAGKVRSYEATAEDTHQSVPM